MPGLSIAGLVAVVRSVRSDALSATDSALHAAADHLATAEGVFASVTRASTNLRTRKATSSPREAVDTLRRTLTALDAADRGLEAYLLVVTGTGSPAVGGPGTGSGVEPEDTGLGVLPGFRPDEPHADAIAAIRRFGWPKNRKGLTSARGPMYDADGNRLPHRPFKARKKGTVYHTPELKEPWRSDPEMATTRHIEGGVAA